LFRLALSILADRALAEDAVHQAFMRLLSRGRIDELACARAFLRTVVRHEAYRLLPRRAAEYCSSGAPLLEELPGTPDPGPQQKEEQQQLENAIRQLSPEQREVLMLKLWEDLTFAQIAEVLAIPQNTAASRYRYALERLREILGSTPSFAERTQP
jgi:RNA polymerase sigma-70 factor, ECF subfamily